MRRLLFILLLVFVGCAQQPVVDEAVDLEPVVFDYGFHVEPPDGYSFREFDGGVLMRKMVKGIWNDEESEYWVEIGVFGDGGEGNWRDVALFVSTKYPGYSLQYVGDSIDDGVFVDDYDNGSAVKHFFIMSDGVLYEAYMKVPSYFYAVHEAEFLGVVEGLTFL